MEHTKEVLFDAAWKGDLETFREVLPHFKKTITSLKNERHQSVLFCACRSGRVSIVAELLHLKSMTKGEISKPQGPNGCTPLHAASWGDFPEIVALLLIQGADMNVCNDDKQPPEREAQVRSSIVFDKFKIGGEALIQDYVPVVVRKDKKKKKKILSPVPVASNFTKTKTKKPHRISNPPCRPLKRAFFRNPSTLMLPSHLPNGFLT